MIPLQWKVIPDWMRMVATQVNPILQGYPFMELDTAPTGVRAGFTYYDSALAKVRTWDGAAWNNHW